MAPELVPLAAPVPLPSWFEWVKLIVPPILTGLVVLVGAYITYLFANKGRKEDILYKERYKGFEEIAGYLSHIESICYKQRTKLPDRNKSRVTSLQLINVIEDTKKELESAKEKTPNDKFLSLMPSGVSSEYLLTNNLIDDFIKEYPIDINRKKELATSEEARQELLHNFTVSLISLETHCLETKDAAFESLNLPKR